MMGKQKHKKSDGKHKGREADASLGALLAKHWEQQHWDAYVTLFLRHQGKALKLEEAQRLDAALYNCLTNALFVRRDMPAVEMAVQIILSSNGESLPLSDETRQCAAVARAMLEYRQYGRAVEAPCPESPAYAALRAYVAASPMVAAPRTREYTNAAALLDKMARQYAALPTAKTVAAYTHWHKNARALATLLPQEPAFEVLACVTGLIRQLKDAAHPLREPRAALAAARLALGDGLTPLGEEAHPGVATLMHIFLCLGQQCYGEEWASVMRVAVYRYLPDSCLDPREALQLNALGALSANPAHKKGAFGVLQGLLARRAAWSDKEYFVLGCLCVALAGAVEDTPLAIEKLAPRVFELVLLLPVVRPQQPAPEILVDVLGVLALTQAHIIPQQVISLLQHFPASTLVLLMAGNLVRRRACNFETLARQAGVDIPLRLVSGDVDRLSMMFSELPQKLLTSLCAVLTPESRAALCDALLRDMLEDALLLCQEGASLRDQNWRTMNAARRDFFLAHLEKTSPWRPLLALCGDAPFTLAASHHIGEAFLDFLTRHEQPLALVRWLCQWKGADLELFKTLDMALESRIFAEKQWQEVLEALEAMPASLRSAAMDVVLKRWKRNKCGEPSFKYFRHILELMHEKGYRPFGRSIDF